MWHHITVFEKYIVSKISFTGQTKMWQHTIIYLVLNLNVLHKYY